MGVDEYISDGDCIIIAPEYVDVLTEEEFNFVLMHEVAHLTGDHIRLRNAALANVLGLRADASAYEIDAAGMQSSPETQQLLSDIVMYYEIEADQKAVRTTGVSGTVAIMALAKVVAKTAELSVDTVLAMFDTVEAMAARINALKSI